MNQLAKETHALTLSKFKFSFYVVKNLYKSDFTNWMKGIGWVPIDSLEVEKAKKAGEILSEKKYRQHPEKLKFTYSMDTMEQELNKNNKLTMDKVRTHLLASAQNPPSAHAPEPGTASMISVCILIFLMVLVVAVVGGAFCNLCQV